MGLEPFGGPYDGLKPDVVGRMAAETQECPPLKFAHLYGPLIRYWC